MEIQDQFEFVTKEIEAIYEDFDSNIEQLITIRAFLKITLNVIKGAKPFYQLSEVKSNNETKEKHYD